MPYINPDHQRDYQREWARRKRNGEPTNNISPRKLLSIQEKVDRKLEYQRRYTTNLRKKAENLVGTKCIICSSDKSLIYHRKDGKSHNDDFSPRDVIKEPQEFVRLCYGCHKGVHWVMKWFNLSWGEIIERLKYLKKNIII